MQAVFLSQNNILQCISLYTNRHWMCSHAMKSRFGCRSQGSHLHSKLAKIMHPHFTCNFFVVADAVMCSNGTLGDVGPTPYGRRGTQTRKFDPIISQFNSKFACQYLTTKSVYASKLATMLKPQ